MPGTVERMIAALREVGALSLCGGSYRELVLPALTAADRIEVECDSALVSLSLPSLTQVGALRYRFFLQLEALDIPKLTRAAQLDLPEIESFWFESSRGKRVHSYVVRPPGFDPIRL